MKRSNYKNKALPNMICELKTHKATRKKHGQLSKRLIKTDLLFPTLRSLLHLMYSFAYRRYTVCIAICTEYNSKEEVTENACRDRLI